MAPRKRKSCLPVIGASLMALIFLAALSTTIAYSLKLPEAPRMSKEQLRGLLGDPNTIVLDVRIRDDWKESTSKIPGAIRVDPNRDLGTLMEKLPKDKTLVFYCS